MKLRYTMLTVALSLMATASLQAAEMGGMKMDGAKMEEPAKATVHRTKGVVKELDARKGTVTLSHDAVPSINWPAMTMTFKVTPELAKGIQVGQKVDFEFQAQGTTATITKMSPAR